MYMYNYTNSYNLTAVSPLVFPSHANQKQAKKQI